MEDENADASADAGECVGADVGALQILCQKKGYLQMASEHQNGASESGFLSPFEESPDLQF